MQKVRKNRWNYRGSAGLSAEPVRKLLAVPRLYLAGLLLLQQDVQTASLGYTPRHPEESLLYRVVAEQLETFLARQQERDRAVPGFVEEEFRSFLRCGLKEFGFLRLRCDTCRKDRLLSAVPVRQWVLSLPYSLRFRVAFDSELLGQVLGIFVREVFASLRRRARDNGIPKGKCGSMTFVQRFGSALNCTPHFHAVVFDGVYACGEKDEPLRFYSLRPPDAKEVAAVASRVAVRVAAMLVKRDGAAGQEEPAMADLYGASITGTLAMGPNAGQKVKTAGDFQDESFESHGSRCAMASGFSVHAGVSIRAEDRKGLERLIRYTARPLVAMDRLAQLPDGRLSYRLKTPWRNGTTHVIFEPLESLARLAVLVPAPRVNTLRFHGVFGPAAKWRSAIVPKCPEIEANACRHGKDRNEKQGRRRNYVWASLMARVFEIDVLKCPDCNGRHRILAAIHPPLNTRKILTCMGLPSRAPPFARAVSESTL